MVWLWVLVFVIIIGAAAVVVAGRGDAMADVYEDRPDMTLERGRPLTADDLARVRFTTAVRGYRMDEVDAFVTRIEAELRAGSDGVQSSTSPGPSGPGGPDGSAADERR